MMIRSKYLYLLGLVFLFSCKQRNPNAFIVEGSISNADGELLKIVQLHENATTPIDSTFISDAGTFSLEGETDEPAFYALTLKKYGSITLIIHPGDDISINADAQSLQESYKVEGSQDSKLIKELNDKSYYYYEKLLKLNDRYEKYKAREDHSDYEIFTAELDSVYNVYRNEYRTYVLKFIDNNLTSQACYIALHQVFAPQDNLLDPYSEDYKYFNKVDSALQANYPESEVTRHMSESMRQINERKAYEDMKRDQLSYGMQAPEISLSSPQGEIIPLSSLKGKYVLLDFWASWCTPCRQENPNLVRIYKKYARKGFTIYQVSLDRTKQSWEEAIKADNLSAWYHVSDLQFWNSAVVPVYNIHSIPSNYLLNKKGQIIAKDLRGNQLDKALSEIFK